MTRRKRTKERLAVYRDFARKMKGARLTQGLTQKQVAEALGLTETNVCYWEAAKRRMYLDDYVLLCRVLGIKAAV